MSTAYTQPFVHTIAVKFSSQLDLRIMRVACFGLMRKKTKQWIGFPDNTPVMAMVKYKNRACTITVSALWRVGFVPSFPVVWVKSSPRDNIWGIKRRYTMQFLKSLNALHCCLYGDRSLILLSLDWYLVQQLKVSKRRICNFFYHFFYLPFYILKYKGQRMDWGSVLITKIHALSIFSR